MTPVTDQGTRVNDHSIITYVLHPMSMEAEFLLNSYLTNPVVAAAT